MNCKKRMLSIIAATALITAAAVPVLALENEFHGLFGARYINSNFNRTETTDYGPGDGTYDPSGKTKDHSSANFVEQRARLQYIAKANPDLKLVTHFELDYSYWGNSSYTVGRNQGGAIGADTVNLETKSIYLDANPIKNVNMKLGMMPNNDAFKGVLFDTDMAGAIVSSSYSGFTPTIGFFRFNDKSPATLGKNTRDLFMLDGKYEVAKDLKVGAAYYYFMDNLPGATTVTPVGTPTGFTAAGQPIYNSVTTTTAPNNDTKIHVLGLNAECGHGPLTLNGFFVFETGKMNKIDVNSYAANAGAKYKIGTGTARTEFLYVSGDDGKSASKTNAFYAVDGEHGYYDNEMVILGRDKNAFTTDNSIIYNAGNKGQGQIGGYLGYDLPVTDKLATAFNVGFAAVDKDNAAKPINLKTGAANKSNYLGTEINAEANYKLMDNLKASFRVGYVMLGDYYKDVAINGTPVNPYDAKLIFKYTF